MSSTTRRTTVAPGFCGDYVVLYMVGGVRMKSDPNVYYFPGSGNYLMVYVDDLELMGPDPLSLFQSVAKKVLLKQTDELTEGATVKFFGRRVTLREGVAEIYMNEDYIQQISERAWTRISQLSGVARTSVSY